MGCPKGIISDVISEPLFGNYGRLIFPTDSGYFSGDTLGTLKLTWYSNIDPEKTVEIANYMKNHAANGEAIFYDIYTDEEKEDALPKPGAVVMQYTGHSDYTENDPPTYVCVGENDGIADWRAMENRLEHLAASGLPTEFHKYPGLGHGFGLGTGTAAEGWIEDAVSFWETQTKY